MEGKGAGMTGARRRQGSNRITVRPYEVVQGKVSPIGIFPPDDPLFTRGTKIGEAERVENHVLERPSEKSEK